MSGKKNTQLQGTSIAPGLAMGNAFVYQNVLEQDLVVEGIPPEQIESECERVRWAAQQVTEQLEESVRQVTRQIGSYQAEIFGVQQAMLRDLLKSHEIGQEMERQRIKAEAAVQNVFGRWVKKMRAQESLRFTQRAEDVADLGRELLRKLLGIRVHPLEKMTKGNVLVASRLLPSDAVFFASRAVAAVIVEFGGRSSHCALMTRQMGIPGICNAAGATNVIASGDFLLVDGFRETVVVEPEEVTRSRFAKRIEEYYVSSAKAKQKCHEAAITTEGVMVPVMANIGNQIDVRVAVENGADGVGLYRLEELFMLHKTLPTEQQLLQGISDTLAALKGRPAAVRLLDAGSDKNLPYVEFADEPAPCLGMRGVRVLLGNPELLNVQLRALLRLSQSREIQIMVPMVTLPEDIKAVREALESQASELGITNIPPLVAMIETPAAAMCVPDILQFADTLSLGTNDLTQYTMVAGRQNPLVQHYFQDDHPLILRLIRQVVREAGQTPVAVCGELASQPDAVPFLLDAGIRMLSVAPPLVPTMKEAVRNFDRHNFGMDANESASCEISQILTEENR